MIAEGLTGWIPARIHTHDQSTVEWLFVGDDTFRDPFFEQSVQRALRKPFNQLFARETGMETLTECAEADPGLKPTAFLFHTSRCASTLFAQQARALPQTIVISEAPPVDEVLRAPVAECDRIAWLRALLSVLGQRRRGDERHYFVKFDAWHVLDIALIQRAFPEVPCVFLYRHPAAVMASQMRMPGSRMIPGALDPAVIGLDLPGVLQLGRHEYIGRVLVEFYKVGLAAAVAGRVRLMNYAELPDAATSRLLSWCGLTDKDEVRDRLNRVAESDAKTPSLPYEAGPEPEETAVEIAERLLGPYYEKLETLRLGGNR